MPRYPIPYLSVTKDLISPIKDQDLQGQLFRRGGTWELKLSEFAPCVGFPIV